MSSATDSAPLAATGAALGKRPSGPSRRGGSGYPRYVAGKLGGAVVSLFAVLVTSFFLFRLIPGDPVKFMTCGRPVSAEQLAVYR
ncbi:ABC transporter permease, partial [Streptomyces sp. NPDC057074]